MSDIHKDLKALGQSASSNGAIHEASIAINNAAESYKLLERFPSPHSLANLNPNGVSLTLDISTSEFTSLCPMTGQPDFAKIVILYHPIDWCVESKSLKLYFLSYRNRRDFHESCVVNICNDLATLLEPKYLKVTGEFTPRGGIPFWPSCEFYTKRTL
jgi:7-cyano-7-deazaguanine reductase